MKTKELVIILLTLFAIGILNVLVFGEGTTKENITEDSNDLFKELEIDEYFDLPVLEFEKYNEEELTEVLSIFKEEGVSLQKALVIPISTAISVEEVIENDVDFNKYTNNIKIILNSTAHYIDEYAKFTTDNLSAKQYHTSMVLASRQIHNGLVYYYSSLVYDKDEEKYVINKEMMDKGTELISKYYEYIGINEYVYDYIQKVDKDGLEEYINKVNKETEIVLEDIVEKIK